MRIQNDEDLEKALQRVKELWLVEPGDPDWDERKAQVDQITAYEDEHHPIPPPSLIDAIKFRVEQGGLNLRNMGFLATLIARRMKGKLESWGRGKRTR